MGNLRDKYTDEEWDILVEESKQHKLLIEPTTHTLTKQELIDLIIYVKVYSRDPITIAFSAIGIGVLEQLT